MHRIHKGLQLPISGSPNQTIVEAVATPTAALVGHDYHNLKPQMLVQTGDKVKVGQPLFRDKSNPDVVFASPASGVVQAINRGLKRSLQSVVVTLEGSPDQVTIAYKTNTSADARQALLTSGLWTALRTRPFSAIPQPDITPQALFINAMDTNPLAADPAPLISERTEDFCAGIRALHLAFDCPIHLCHGEGATMPSLDMPNLSVHAFSGKHPSGNVGTHMHFIAPAGRDRTNLHINYQDTIAIGRLFTSGDIDTSRVLALGGPKVSKPCLIRSQLGADILTLVRGRIAGANNRILSGSVFNGRRAEGGFAWLGRYHLQMTVLEEGNQQHLLPYLSAGLSRFSVMPIYLSHLMRKNFSFTTTTNGSERAMVPIGSYEKVMPLDILPTQLLRSLIVRDLETAEQLGCLELDEEDLALCTFVCPGKYEYAPILRENLTLIQKEG